MDSLILSFTPEQYDSYKKIKELARYEHIELDLGFSSMPLTTEEHPPGESLKQIEIMKESALSLFSHEHKARVFREPLTKAEIDAFIPHYYSVIARIDEARRALYFEMNGMLRLISQLDAERCSLCERYASFLPYKAALLDDVRYAEEIAAIDLQLITGIRHLEETMKKEQEHCVLIQKVCEDIVPQFSGASAAAAGSPRFSHFDDAALFGAVRIFLERLNNLRLEY